MTPKQPDNSRNTIIFFVGALALMLVYEFFVAGPQARHQQELARQREAAQRATGVAPGAEPAPVMLSRDQALRATQRVPISTPALQGSINLTGAAIDDLFLTRYRQTTDKNSPPVELFRPVGADHAYYATVNWGGAEGMPDVGTPWQLVSGSTLSPGHPIDLQFASVNGLSFRRHITVDDDYMFTVTDTVTNTSNHPVQAEQRAAVSRRGLPADIGKAGGTFEGALGAFPGNGSNSETKQQNFKDWKKKGTTTANGLGGWVGLTDKYWLGAVIPADQKTPIQGVFRTSSQGSVDNFAAGFVGPTQTIAPGAQVQKSVRIFAGAKVNNLLEQYGKTYGIPNFKLAIDWGFLWFLTQPLFWLLQHIRMGVLAVLPHAQTPAADYSLGISILLLTVVVRGVMFPLAFQSYASMSKMKKIQPLVEELRKKYADDQMKQQQEMMQLYQREKINPIAGCLPMLLTIPIFFALFKMLYVSIELRHAPFFGWIRDLSAPDPTTIFNLFGLIPWDPAHLPLVGAFFATWLHIGGWPILYGLTTFLQMQMSPTSTDPTQQAMMKFMPFLFMAFLAAYPAGLLIYYVWSNVITIGQQWFMMNRHGVENPIDSFIARLRDRGARGSRKAAGG